MQENDHINAEGIEQSEIVAGILGTTVRSIINIDTNQDGEIQLLEGLNAVQVIAVKVIRKIPDLNTFKLEIKDYTEGEKDQLIDQISAEMGIEKAKTRELVKRGARIILDVIDLIIDAGRPASDFEIRL